ncbi:MAG: ferritin family protein [Planctomycetota bacterium]
MLGGTGFLVFVILNSGDLGCEIGGKDGAAGSGIFHRNYVFQSTFGRLAEMDYEDLLLWAMKKEKASFRLYAGLAAIVKGAEMWDTLLSVSQEEAKHKVKLEIDYDDLMAKRE